MYDLEKAASQSWIDDDERRCDEYFQPGGAAHSNLTTPTRPTVPGPLTGILSELTASEQPLQLGTAAGQRHATSSAAAPPPFASTSLHTPLSRCRADAVAHGACDHGSDSGREVDQLGRTPFSTPGFASPGRDTFLHSPPCAAALLLSPPRDVPFQLCGSGSGASAITASSAISGHGSGHSHSSHGSRYLSNGSTSIGGSSAGGSSSSGVGRSRRTLVFGHGTGLEGEAGHGHALPQTSSSLSSCLKMLEPHTAGVHGGDGGVGEFESEFGQWCTSKDRLRAMWEQANDLAEDSCSDVDDSEYVHCVVTGADMWSWREQRRRMWPWRLLRR